MEALDPEKSLTGLSSWLSNMVKQLQVWPGSSVLAGLPNQPLTSLLGFLVTERLRLLL